MNYSKLTREKMLKEIRIGNDQYFFQGKRIDEIYTDEGIRYEYEEKRGTSYSTLLQACKNYRKAFE